MKNKLYTLLFYLSLLIFINQDLLSDEIIFNTKEINFTDNGNKIEALNGIALSELNNFEIEAERFLYDKKNLILTAEKNFSNFKKIKINARSELLKYKKKQSIIELNQNVLIQDLTNNINLQGEKIIYDLKKK